MLRTVALVTLACSAIALAAAPVLMAPDYSWVAHTTSESAAQGVDGAWLARTGLALFGVGALTAVIQLRHGWNRAAIGFQAVFALMLVATAAFPTRPWRQDDPFDPTLDLLHSVAATAVGLAFTAGALAVLMGWSRIGPLRRVTGVVAIAASFTLPLAMLRWPEASGALQRCMFAVAYLWFVAELLAPRGAAPSTDE